MPQQRTMVELQPAGMISYFANSTAPSGWLLCNGGYINRTTYSDLFAAIGTTYGTTEGSNFAVPDCRGEFLRGWDNGRGVDSNSGSNPRTFGTFQKSSLQAYNVPNNEGAIGGYSISSGNDPQGGRVTAGTDYVPQSDYTPTGSIHNSTGPGNAGDWINDTGWGGGGQRPRNVALLICIKY